METRLDHIAVVAPDLAAGVGWVQDALGIAIPAGGAHPQMGTHNHLARLGDDLFLEVIAADPGADAPAGYRRWFGLDDTERVKRDWDAGRRLRGYVARCDGLRRTIGYRSDTYGDPMLISRGERQWMFGVRADGELPGDGALPSLMDWGEAGSPASAMPDLGLSLVQFVVETPEPRAVNSALDSIRMNSDFVIRRGVFVKLIAAIETPHGVRILT